MSEHTASGRFAGLSKILTAFVVLALLAAAAISLWPGNDDKYMTVDFSQATSLYEGSDVKVLGVPVGTVETIEPKGDVVRVRIAYDSQYDLPADVKAAIISPSVIGDRFVQLAPAYSGGPVLEDNAALGEDRSNVPVELDEIYQSLDDLAVALGPEGVNADGTLSRFVDVQAENFDGQGEQFNETIKNFARLSTTFSNNKDELFGSVEEIQEFVALLKRNDPEVRAFNDSTADVAAVLEGEREDLAAVIETLGLALIDVRGFVDDNRSALRGNVEDLASISNVLAKNVDAIEESATTAPSALANLGYTYNAGFATLDTRADTSFLPENLAEGLPEDLANLLLCGPTDDTPLDDGVSQLCEALGGGLGTTSEPEGDRPGPNPELLEDLMPRVAAASTPQQSHRSWHEMLAVN